MPFKDREQRRTYQREWLRRKKLGLPTKTRTKLEAEEIVKHYKESKMKYREKRKILRQEKLKEKFGELCLICGDIYRLQIHRKDGTSHKQIMNMGNKEFQCLLSSDDFTQLCFNCHKAVHWNMYYLNMSWDEIFLYRLYRPHSNGPMKNKYHA